MAATIALTASALVKWNAEIESILITEIHQKPQLWDVKSPLYKMRTLKRTGYEEISEKLKVLFQDHAVLFTDKKINAKFGNLKTIYSRIVRKLKNLKSGSSCEGFSSPWVHYQQMAFLDNVIAATHSSSNLDTLADIQDSQDTLSVIDEEPINVDMQLQEESQSLLDASDIFSQPLNYVRELAINEAGPCNSSLDAADLPQPSLVPNTGVTPRLSKTPTGQKRKRQAPPEKELLTTACETLRNLNSIPESAQDALGHYISLKLKTISDSSKRNLAEADLLKTLQKYLD